MQTLHSPRGRTRSSSAGWCAQSVTVRRSGFKIDVTRGREQIRRKVDAPNRGAKTMRGLLYAIELSIIIDEIKYCPVSLLRVARFVYVCSKLRLILQLSDSQ